MRFKFIFKLIVAYASRFSGLIILGILCGIAIFFFANLIIPRISLKSTQKIGIAGRYTTNNLPLFILEMAGDGLTSLAESGTPEPNLANSWQSPDKGRTWIFTLKDEIYWQDKSKVNAYSINYEFSNVSQEVTDEKTLIFRLNQPFSPFPSVVSKPTFKKGLLGTGDWKVKKALLKEGFVSELELAKKGQGNIIYKFFPTEDRAILAFKLGEVDKIINLLDASDLEIWKTARIEATSNKNQVVTLFFNTQDPTLSEKSLRQALIYAIDKNALGDRAYGPISPLSWAFNPNIKQYNFDIDRAKDLIKDLPQELRDKPIKLVSTPGLLIDAEKISKDWENIGIKTNVQVSSIIPQEFQVYLTIFDIPKDPDQYSIWHSTQISTNISKYSSPRIDKLLEDGRSELDLNERRKIYLDFQRFLLEDLPAAFLYHPKYFTVYRN